MVSQGAVNAIRQVLRKSKRSGQLADDREWRKEEREAASQLLTPNRLTEQRAGRPLAGLRKVLQKSGGPSDSSRIIGHVHSSTSKIKTWCAQLLDMTSEPGERLAVTQDSRAIPHLGRNAFSVLLHLKEPDKFGFLNKPVEDALRALGEWPRFPRGSGQGDRYLIVNGVLNELANKVGLRGFKGDKLAVLDQLLWYFQDSDGRVKTAKSNGGLPPGDPDKDAELALEGGKHIKTHLKTERNSRAAALFKALRAQKHPNLDCEVCGFSFQRVYGELGSGFIEAHHRELLSARRRRRRPQEDDYDFVCSNCHRMLHRMGDAMDAAALKKVIQRTRQK